MTGDVEPAIRRLEVTEDRIRAYSRRGNYHSEGGDAQRLGLPGLVAQGVQVAGPAYGLLLDAWGEEFLAHGELDVRFVGMVTAGQTVEARVAIDTDGGTATIEVVEGDRTVVVGSAAYTRGLAGSRPSTIDS